MRLNIQKLEKIRTTLGLGVYPFSQMIGISHTAYYNILNSQFDPHAKMCVATISKIATNLKVSEKDLLIFDR
jgi:DNA-binding XRE family transcriptional regulator